MGWNIYACFDVYPATAGTGIYTLNIIVDYNNEVRETDESMDSNIESTTITIQK
jgi:hypothetical protein